MSVIFYFNAFNISYIVTFETFLKAEINIPRHKFSSVTCVFPVIRFSVPLCSSIPLSTAYMAAKFPVSRTTNFKAMNYPGGKAPQTATLQAALSATL